jgi:hypothetical protein
MASDGKPSNRKQARILRFRHRRSSDRAGAEHGTPVKDLSQYERRHEADDYRHRMLVNIAAFVFVIALIGAGLWLANSLAQLRKNQDCAMSGRRNCAPIEVNRDRW